MGLPIRLLILLSLAGFNLPAQILPPERYTDWRQPGAGEAPPWSHTLDLTDLGADPTGILPSDEALDQALALLQRPGRIYFPEGTYLFRKTLDLPDSILLEGPSDPEGRPLSLLRLDPGENRHGIRIQGTQMPLPVQLAEAPRQGRSWILVGDAQDLLPGQTLRLHALDDSLLVHNTWGYHTTGQILTVAQVFQDTVFFTRPLRRDYDPERLPLLYRIQPARQVHIRCLALERVDATSNQTANIFLQWARDCSVSGVSSRLCNFAHVDLRYATHITVANSFFSEGHEYGGGGKAYGVMLQSGSGDCLIAHNVFRTLRHSMILQSGANGNVLAYNYSIEPFWTGTFLPANSAGDLVLHGNYPYMNLFEGNVVQNIVIDNSHGRNGPHNTLFRNRAELYGIFMNANPASDRQNFIGNQVSNTGSPLLGLFALQGSGHFSYGNVVKGILQPPGSAEPDSLSLFSYGFGSFYAHVATIPPITTTNWNSTVALIEAAHRSTLSEPLPTICAELEYTPTRVVHIPPGEAPQLYPNPARDRITLRMAGLPAAGLPYRIIHPGGTIVGDGLLTALETAIPLGQIPPGMYWLCIAGHPPLPFVILP